MIETTRAPGRESIDKILGIRRRDVVEPCFASIKKKYSMNGWENMDYEKNRLAADRVVVDVVDNADDAIGMRNFWFFNLKSLIFFVQPQSTTTVAQRKMVKKRRIFLCT